jgi:TRAP-type transport system periplasmic protein
MRIGSYFAGACAALIIASPALAAKRPRMANFTPPTYVMTTAMHTGWAALVKEYTKGEIDWEVFVGGSLVPATGVPQAVASGVAQGGHVPLGYFPSNFPISNIIGDMGALNPDPLVLASAFADYTSHEPALIKEFLNNNALFGVSTLATPAYNYICKGNFASLADLKGKRVRTNGGVWSRFSESIGMVSVNLPSTEIYSAMERGAVDCVTGDLSLIVSFKLSELAKSVVMLKLSPTFAVTQHLYNVDYWRSLTNEQRRAHLDATARGMARGYLAFEAQVKQGTEVAKSRGINLSEPSADLVAAYNKWVKEGFGGLEKMGVEQLGVAHSKEMMDKFVPYLEKWTKLFEGADRSREDSLTAVIKTNLHDTIDVATYGMK